MKHFVHYFCQIFFCAPFSYKNFNYMYISQLKIVHSLLMLYSRSFFSVFLIFCFVFHGFPFCVIKFTYLFFHVVLLLIPSGALFSQEIIFFFSKSLIGCFVLFFQYSLLLTSHAFLLILELSNMIIITLLIPLTTNYKILSFLC